MFLDVPLIVKDVLTKKRRISYIGNYFDNETLLLLINMLDNEFIDGLSILGGDPFEPKNIDEVFRIVRFIKKALPSKTIWIWTGRLLEDIQQTYPEILKYVDVLIDGPFVRELKDSSCKYFGSKNQRMLYKGKDF